LDLSEYDAGGSPDAAEFLVTMWKQEEEDAQIYKNINEFGENPDQQHHFINEERDWDNPDDRAIIEVACIDADRGNGFYGTCGGGIDLDREPGSTCYQFCEAVEAAYNHPSYTYEEYHHACMDRCIHTSAQDNPGPASEQFSLQEAHPDSAARIRCDPYNCLSTCAYDYQYNFYNSECRLDCDTRFDGTNDDFVPTGNCIDSPGECPAGFDEGLVQSLAWNGCMAQCASDQEFGIRNECHNTCGDYEYCLEVFGGAFQKLADNDNPLQWDPAADDAPQQIKAQCTEICSSNCNDFDDCLSKCDSRFFRIDNSGDITVTTMNSIRKDKYEHWCWDEADLESNKCKPPCEPSTTGSVHFGNLDGDKGIGFVFTIDEDHKVSVLDFRWFGGVLPEGG
ncbi:hypothetical protein ACFL1E_07730, partial [Candidatus Omnitrophota bacterium]